MDDYEGRDLVRPNLTFRHLLELPVHPIIGPETVYINAEAPFSLTAWVEAIGAIHHFGMISRDLFTDF